MTEKELEDYEMIIKEIDILSKELMNMKSDQLIVKQNPAQKLYAGPIINKTLEELTPEIAGIENKLQDMIHKLYSKRDSIENYINSVESCEIRLILRLRYIESMTYKEIASRIMVNGRSRDGLHEVTWNAISDKLKRFFKKQNSK